MQFIATKRSFKSLALLTVAVLFTFSACKESENLVGPPEGFRPFIPHSSIEQAYCIPSIGETFLKSNGNCGCPAAGCVAQSCKNNVGDITFCD